MKYIPPGARCLKHYIFAVITETPDQERPPRSRDLFAEYYRLGQILACHYDGGRAMEVGTYIKPSKLGFQYEKFDLMNEAIEFSYQTVNGGFDHKRVGKDKSTWQGGKRNEKHKKFRHRA